MVDAKHSPCDASGSDAGLSKYIEVFPMCRYSSAISLHAPHEFNVRAQSIYFLVALPEDVDLASDFGGRCSAGRYTCLVIDLCEPATGRRGAPYESANSKQHDACPVEVSAQNMYMCLRVAVAVQLGWC